MMEKFANRVGRVAVSPTMVVLAEAEKLRARGVDVVDFGPGEPDFPTPAHIKQAAIEALERNRTKYTPTAGIAPLREAVCRWHAQQLGSSYEPSESIICVGGKHALYNAVMALIQEGDEVLIRQPLGRGVNEPRLLGLDFPYQPGFLALAQAAVQRCRPHPALVRLVGLVLHERDERRNDERGATQTERRYLIAEGFPGAARHDGERVPSREDVLDDLVLAGTPNAHAEGAQRPGERAVLCFFHARNWWRRRESNPRP